MIRPPPLVTATGLRYLGQDVFPRPPPMPTVLVADDHPLFREALRNAVSRALPDAILREADSVDALYALIERETDADLLLLDLNMPGAHGFSALVHLRAHFPQLPIMVVSAREEPAVMRRALDHGAVGFLPKSADATTLGEAIDAVLAGDRWAPASALKAPAAGAEEHDAAQRVRDLTPQQFRVLQMLGDGLLNKQIAYELGVSEATIKAHMTAILRKLGANNRTQAVLIAGKLAIDPEAVMPPPEED
jgi:DNA-binding NarL/FixJ family response regulator